MLILLVAATVATPFIDATERFSLDLPGGWEQGPMPAGASGASFRCTVKDRMALAAVRVVPAAGMSAAALVRKLGEAMETQPGFRLLEEGSAELAGRPAARRRYAVYVDGNPDLVKTAEDRAIVADGKGYVIHVESLSSSFYDFELDFQHVYDTFRLGAKAGPRGASHPVVGTWLMDGRAGTFLELRADGSFDLAGTAGTYAVRGDALRMWMTGGGMEEFAFRLAGDGLVLSGPNLPEPIRYHRSGGTLTGTWEGGGKRVVFAAGGRVEVDGKSGSYRVDGTKLVLKLGKRRVLRFTRTGDNLELKGWKFGKGTKLERRQP